MKRFKNILLVVDGEYWQETALQRAVSLAKHNQADLTTIYALHLPRDTSLLSDSAYGRLTNTIIDDRQKQLEEIAATGPPGVNIRGMVINGAIFPNIIQEILRSGYDLDMKCADETSSLKNRIFGSADTHLLRKCPCLCGS